MVTTDTKSDSVNGAIKEFLKEIDSSFLDPNFNTLDYLVKMIENSQTQEGEAKQRAFLDKQREAVEKCLVPVVQAYYADYNKSLSTLMAICDDFRKNQKEVTTLAAQVEELQAHLSGGKSGIQDLYYEKLLSEYTLKSLKNIEYIRQAPKVVDGLLEHSLYIHASNLYVEVAAMLDDSSIAEVPTVVSLRAYWEMKKKDIENLLMDRLLSVVYNGNSYNWPTFTDEQFSYHELTEEKESELVVNRSYVCSKYSAIAVIIKAATLLGCGMAAQTRLHSNSVNHINQLILSTVRQTLQRIEEHTLRPGRDALEQCLKTILITCEDVFRTHLCCIERFRSSVVAGNLPISGNINLEYSVLGVFSSLQQALRSFVERFVASSTSGPSQLPSHSQSGVSFSFAASTRWAESQRTVLHDLADRKADASLYSRVCEPDPLNLGLVAFYVRSFVEQTTVLAEESLRACEETMRGKGVSERGDAEGATCLSVFVLEHVQSDYAEALRARATSLVLAATGTPESFLPSEESGSLDAADNIPKGSVLGSFSESSSGKYSESSSGKFSESSSGYTSGYTSSYSSVNAASASLESGYASLPTLNCVRRLAAAWDELERSAFLLRSQYALVLPALSHLLETAVGKFTTLAEEMARGSFAKRRVDWAGPSGRQLLRSRAEYARVLREMGCAAETGRVLSAGEAKEEEAAINGDVYSFVAEMEKRQLLPDGRVTLLCGVCEGCSQLARHLRVCQSRLHAAQDARDPVDFAAYDETVETCVEKLQETMELCMELLEGEEDARCYLALQKLKESFLSRSYNNVPPVIMELMKDMRGFAAAAVQRCSAGKTALLGHHLCEFLSTLLMRSITRIPVEVVDDSMICTLKQSGVCCSQIMNLLLPLSETIPVTRRLNDYFSLALMKKEEIRSYIERHPTRFTNVDYMNLFKITTPNRERDDAAIDWIEDILKNEE